MSITANGDAFASLPQRPRTLVAQDGAVWFWPGIPLTITKGGRVFAVEADTIRFWIAKLHGPEAVHSPCVTMVERAAEHLGKGDEIAAQRSLDRSGLQMLSPEGNALMRAVAARLGVESVGLPVMSRNPLWRADEIGRMAKFFDRFAEQADWLEKAKPWDPNQHPRWLPGSTEGIPGRFRPKDGSPGAAPQFGVGHNGPSEPEAPEFGIGHNGGPPLFEGAPKIPEEDPGPSSRWQYVKLVAKWLASKLDVLAAEDAAGGGAIGILLDGAQIAIWIHDYLPYLQAYNEPPKTLGELQAAAQGPSRKGCDVHHIVWQGDGGNDGIPDEQLQGPTNLVSISTLRHWELNSWYQTPNKLYGGMTPRDYLRDKDYATRYEVGLEGLRQVGVLKRGQIEAQ